MTPEQVAPPTTQEILDHLGMLLTRALKASYPDEIHQDSRYRANVVAAAVQRLDAKAAATATAD